MVVRREVPGDDAELVALDAGEVSKPVQATHRCRALTVQPDRRDLHEPRVARKPGAVGAALLDAQLHDPCARGAGLQQVALSDRDGEHVMIVGPRVAGTLFLRRDRLARCRVELREHRLHGVTGDTAMRIEVLEEGVVVSPEVAGVAVAGPESGIAATGILLIDDADEQRCLAVAADDVAADRQRTRAPAERASGGPRPGARAGPGTRPERPGAGRRATTRTGESSVATEGEVA